MSIPLRSAFATWLGWVVPANVPLVIVRNPDQDPHEILWPAMKIGYTTIVGELTGGAAAWVADGGHLSTTRLVDPAHIDTATVVDVRSAGEHAAGHLPGAYLIELGHLTQHADALPDGAITVMCGHGERAATAASLLERAGRTDVSILDGGPQRLDNRHQLRPGRRSMSATAAVRLGLRANLPQFTSAGRGQRTRRRRWSARSEPSLPLLAERVFGIGGYTASLAFIVVVRLTKAVTNLAAGPLVRPVRPQTGPRRRMADRRCRYRCC